MGRITKNYIYNILYQLLVLVTPLILSPYLARILGSENLGIYSYISSASNIVTTVALLGTYSYGTRQIAYCRDDTERCRQVYNEVFSLRLFLGVFATAIYGVLMIIEREYFIYFLIYYMWILSQVLDPSWFFVGQENMKATALKNAVIKIITLVLIFCFVKDTDDLWVYVLVMAGSTLAANLLLYTQMRSYKIHHKLLRTNWKKHLTGSLALFWPQVASLFYLQVDKVMLRYLSGNISEVSFYDYGEKIVTIPLTFITVLSTVMMPRIANEFAKNNGGEVKSLLDKAGSFSLMLAIPMMFGVALCASDLIPWYLGTDYNATISAIICISPIILTNSLAGISGNQYLVATNQMNLLLKAYVSAAVINIVVNALLIPEFGCVGAGIATSISSTVSVVIQYYYLHKQVGIKSFTKYGIRYFLLTIPMIVVVLLIGIYGSSTPVTTIIQVASGVVVYGLMLIITRDKNLRMIVKKVFKK